MKRHKKCKGLLWGFLCAVWGFVCLFPIWVLFSGTFSNDSDNLTQVVFPTSFSNGVKRLRRPSAPLKSAGLRSIP